MEKEINISILSVLDYVDKKNNQERCRIGYVYTDKLYIANNTNFIGRSEMSVYVNGHYRNKFTEDDLKGIYTLVVGEKPSANNPLRSSIVPVEIKKDNITFIKFN